MRSPPRKRLRAPRPFPSPVPVRIPRASPSPHAPSLHPFDSLLRLFRRHLLLATTSRILAISPVEDVRLVPTRRAAIGSPCATAAGFDVAHPPSVFLPSVVPDGEQARRVRRPRRGLAAGVGRRSRGGPSDGFPDGFVRERAQLLHLGRPEIGRGIPERLHEKHLVSRLRRQRRSWGSIGIARRRARGQGVGGGPGGWHGTAGRGLQAARRRRAVLFQPSVPLPWLSRRRARARSGNRIVFRKFLVIGPALSSPR